MFEPYAVDVGHWAGGDFGAPIHRFFRVENQIGNVKGWRHPAQVAGTTGAIGDQSLIVGLLFAGGPPRFGQLGELASDAAPLTAAQCAFAAVFHFQHVEPHLR